MTYEEAIEILRDTPIDIRSAREDDIHTLYATAQMMAIEALEKQIPKKPVCDKEWHFNLLCPCCNRKIADTEHLWDIQRKYLEEQEFRCPCGQAIDWSDDEET